MTLSGLLTLFFLAGLLFPSPALAADTSPLPAPSPLAPSPLALSPLELSGEPASARLPNGHWAVWEDPAATSSLADALAADRRHQFVPLAADSFSGGYSLSRFWFRIDLEAAAGGEGDWYLQAGLPHLEQATLYQPAPGVRGSALEGLEETDGQRWSLSRAGTSVPPAQREYFYRSPLYHIPLAAGERKTIYLAVTSRSTIAIEVKLWRQKAVSRQSLMEFSFLGIVYGTMATTIIFALAMALFSRQRMYYLFALHFATILVLYLYSDGFLTLYLIEGQLWLIRLLPPLFNGLSFGTAILFVCYLTRLPAHFPRLARLFTAASTMEFALGIAGCVAGNVAVAPLMYHILLACLFTYPPVAFVLALRREQGAMLYFVSYFILGMTSLPNLLRNIGVTGTWPWAWQLAQTGMVFQMIIIGIALALGLRQAQKDKDKARRALLETLQRSEQELEHRVSQRTRALATANRQLGSEVRERELVEERLRQAHQRAEIALVKEQTARREQRNFLAMVSHEFRVPLAIVDAAAQVLSLLLPPDQQEAREEVAKTRRATWRMKTIIDTCLAEDWLDEASMRLKPEPLDLVWLVDDLCHEKNSMGSAARIQAETPDNAPCEADPSLLAIVLSNLLDNALKYSPADSPVFLRLEEAAGGWRLEVRDRGPGVADSEREAIFDRFYRSPTVGRVSGAGLGLYVVRRIVELHGGNISCCPPDDSLPEPAPGARGCCFVLFLPASPPASPPVPPAAAGSGSGSGSGSGELSR